MPSTSARRRAVSRTPTLTETPAALASRQPSGLRHDPGHPGQAATPSSAGGRKSSVCAPSRRRLDDRVGGDPARYQSGISYLPKSSDRRMATTSASAGNVRLPRPCRVPAPRGSDRRVRASTAPENRLRRHRQLALSCPSGDEPERLSSPLGAGRAGRRGRAPRCAAASSRCASSSATVTPMQ